jgi:acetyl/propionyl-CoA carboxylase alpha subunit
MADEAYHIGPAPAAESYLVKDKILAVAAASGADVSSRAEPLPVAELH